MVPFSCLQGRAVRDMGTVVAVNLPNPGIPKPGVCEDCLPDVRGPLSF